MLRSASRPARRAVTRSRRVLIGGLVGLVGLGQLAAACGSDDAPSGASTGSGGAGADLRVVASFFPLQYVVEAIGGDRVAVENLTPIGAEPHELELTAANTADLADADLAVYLSGFSPSVDDAVQAVAADHALDIADAARLDLQYRPIEEGQDSGETARDPHFWLDPTRLSDVAAAVEARLAEADPDGADDFAENLSALRSRLADLDDEFRQGLQNCARTDVVTSHNAFGYLADRYGLHQVGITGLTPEDEPSPADLARVATFVEDNGVTTIFYESLVSPTVAETLAAETGATTAVLDPLEGLPESASPATSYVDIMRANLTALRAGLGCP